MVRYLVKHRKSKPLPFHQFLNAYWRPIFVLRISNWKTLSPAVFELDMLIQWWPSGCSFEFSWMIRDIGNLPDQVSDRYLPYDTRYPKWRDSCKVTISGCGLTITQCGLIIWPLQITGHATEPVQYYKVDLPQGPTQLSHTLWHIGYRSQRVCRRWKKHCSVKILMCAVTAKIP